MGGFLIYSTCFGRLLYTFLYVSVRQKVPLYYLFLDYCMNIDLRSVSRSFKTEYYINYLVESDLNISVGNGPGR